MSDEFEQRRERPIKNSATYVVSRYNSEMFREMIHEFTLKIGNEIGRAFENGMRAVKEETTGETVTISVEELKRLKEYEWKYKELCK